MISIKVELLLIFLCVLTVVGVYNVKKRLPEGTSLLGEEYKVPSESITFLSDRTYINEIGERQLDHEIFDEVISMIEKAEKYILIDMFLYNDFQGNPPEQSRRISDELTQALIEKKNAKPDISITVISDPINTAYGGAISSHFPLLRDNNIKVVITDLTSLRDSNPMYSVFWRTLIQWFGNEEQAGYIPHPFQTGGHRVTIRSWLSLLNFKANHRKLIVADQPQPDGTTKMATLITSANPHDGSSAHDNTAVKVEDKLWKDVVKSEQVVGNISNESIPVFNGAVFDAEGAATVQLLTEGAIKHKLVELIESTHSGDDIDMIMFYLSDRSIVNSLIRAANRGVKIQLVLDANKDAFGMKKNGVPNRPVAHELLKKSDNRINIRWCYTTGEQCHSKMILFRIGDRHTLVTGSANLTRRNIGDYNLETDVLVTAREEISAIVNAHEYFSEVWDNGNNRVFTTDYETYADDSLLKTVLYRVQEFTGMSSF